MTKLSRDEKTFLWILASVIVVSTIIAVLNQVIAS